MNEERLIHEGLRAELKQQRQELAIRLNSIRKSLRLACDPMTPPGEIKGEEVFMLAKDLLAVQIDFREVEEKLERIKEILGR